MLETRFRDSVGIKYRDENSQENLSVESRDFI